MVGTDTNGPRIVRELGDIKKELHALTRVLKTGLGVKPTAYQGLDPVEVIVLGDDIPVKMDWSTPSFDGRAVLIQSGNKVQVVITVDDQDSGRFIGSVLQDVPELLQVSSMSVD